MLLTEIFTLKTKKDNRSDTQLNTALHLMMLSDSLLKLLNKEERN